MGDLNDNLFHKLRKDRFDALYLKWRALRLHNGHLVLDGARIVRVDLGAKAVLEWCDDAPAVGIVLGVGTCNDKDIKWQTNLVAADLHVALFHNVEQTNLDALGEIGQLVDTEYATVRARNQAVVNGQLVGEIASLSNLNGIHLPHQIGD